MAVACESLRDGAPPAEGESVCRVPTVPAMRIWHFAPFAAGIAEFEFDRLGRASNLYGIPLFRGLAPFGWCHA